MKLTWILFPWASCQIRKIAGCACAGNTGNVSAADLKRDRYARAVHGRIANMWWRGKRYTGITGPCAPRNVSYLARRPLCDLWELHKSNTPVGILRKSYICHNVMTSSNGNISTLLALCEGNSPVSGGILSQRASNVGLWCSFAISLNKRLNKHSIGRWFETPWRSFAVMTVAYITSRDIRKSRFPWYIRRYNIRSRSQFGVFMSKHITFTGMRKFYKLLSVSGMFLRFSFHFLFHFVYSKFASYFPRLSWQTQLFLLWNT